MANKSNITATQADIQVVAGIEWSIPDCATIVLDTASIPVIVQMIMKTGTEIVSNAESSAQFESVWVCLQNGPRRFRADGR